MFAICIVVIYNSISRVRLKEPYGRILSRFKEPVSFLEIGLDTGNSLKGWKSFFPTGSVIYGIDIRLDNIEADLKPFTVHEIDSTNEELANKFFTDEMFDAIVDDGGPTCHVDTFRIYSKKLKRNGIYLIETFKKSSPIEVVFEDLKKAVVGNHLLERNDGFILYQKI